jgi:hypothetical protein
MTTTEDRSAAACFYLRKHTGVVQDWIDSDVDENDRVDEDIKALAVLLAEVRASGAAAERKLHPKPEAAVVTLIETIDDLHKKLIVAQEEITALKLVPVTSQP